MATPTFETLVRAVCDAYDDVFASCFPLTAAQRAVWRTPDLLTEVCVGAEQGKPFLRWSAGGLVDDGTVSTVSLRGGYGRSVDVDLSAPAGGEEADWDDRIAALLVVASGLALLRLRGRTDLGISWSPSATTFVSRDLEADVTMRCSAVDGTDALCGSAEARAFLGRLAALPGGVTLAALERSAPPWEVLISSPAPPPSTSESPLQALLATARRLREP